MKRITVRPGKATAVSSKALALAQGALKVFGVTSGDLERLASFRGDVTIGPVATPDGKKSVQARTVKLKAAQPGK